MNWIAVYTTVAVVILACVLYALGFDFKRFKRVTLPRYSPDHENAPKAILERINRLETSHSASEAEFARQELRLLPTEEQNRIVHEIEDEFDAELDSGIFPRNPHQLRREIEAKLIVRVRQARTKTYSISEDGKSITCHRCGMTSHNENDVGSRYCGKCHMFHV